MFAGPLKLKPTLTEFQNDFLYVEEMNEEMVKRWNAAVSPGDTVYYLGDFSLAKRPVELFVPRLNGEKHFIMGNHDACHPCHQKKSICRLLG